jgi:polyhydroxybutyrate depolymerase
MRSSLLVWMAVLLGALGPPDAPLREGEGVLGEWVASGGRKRTYVLHVPPSYDGSRPFPLVVAFHGARGMHAFAENVGLDAAADRHGYVVASPDGSNGGGFALGCRGCTVADRAGVDDVRFFRTLVAQISRGLAIDRHRVFATGFSDGGSFSYRLACERPGDLAAVAVVSGTLFCQPGRAVPVLAIHGTDDPVIPFEQGLSAVRAWATAAGCNDSPRSVPVPAHGSDRTAVTRLEFQVCGTEVRFLQIQGGGHSWPGAPMKYPAWTGRQSAQIDASDAILEFFDKRK